MEAADKDKEKEREEESLKKVEAVLFLSAQWLSIEDIVKFTGINPITVKELLQELEKKYIKENSSITILRKTSDESNEWASERWKMDVKPEFHHLINKLATGQTEFTKAEQETLAVIAYKQPIRQSVVVKIRGNKAYDHIKHFIECGLLKAKKVSRTLELNVTEQFYNYFNLSKDKKEVGIKEKNKEMTNKEIEVKKEVSQNKDAIADSRY